jgi:hypothetical protein
LSICKCWLEEHSNLNLQLKQPKVRIWFEHLLLNSKEALI